MMFLRRAAGLQATSSSKFNLHRLPDKKLAPGREAIRYCIARCDKAEVMKTTLHLSGDAEAFRLFRKFVLAVTKLFYPLEPRYRNGAPAVDCLDNHERDEEEQRMDRIEGNTDDEEEREND